MRAAAGRSVLLGLGFGIPCVFAIRHLARTGEVWTFMGFPTYGRGPFERLGVPTSIPLLVGFLVVCVAEVVVGVLLWTDASYAPLLSYALSRSSSPSGSGSRCPSAVLGLVRTVLLLLA